MGKLNASQLAGSSSHYGREEHDYYATDPKAVQMLLNKHQFTGEKILEPCVGGGHIADYLNDYYKTTCDGIDIVDRGYPNTLVCDFLKKEITNKYDTIITNPPYSLAKEFAEKSLEVLEDKGQLAMFLKIQFLEGAKRKDFFEKYPPKFVYVFRNRMGTLRNGSEINPETGKKWASTTMCHAWFVWEKGCEGEPIVRWL